MSKLDEFTNYIVDDVAKSTGDRELFLDGAFGVIIREILIAILSESDLCGDTPDGLSNRATNPTWRDRIVLNMLVRREMGRRAFRKSNGRDIAQSILNVGSKVHVDELKELLKEV